jgi:hypothetical protein
LADALRVYGKRAAAIGRLPEAIAACEEAVGHLQKGEDPARDEQLGRALYELALAQSQASDHPSALRSADESASHYRRAAARQPRSRPDLALSLSYAAKTRYDRREELGQALDQAREAAAIFQQLSQRDEDMFGPYARRCAALVRQIEGR